MTPPDEPWVDKSDAVAPELWRDPFFVMCVIGVALAGAVLLGVSLMADERPSPKSLGPEIQAVKLEL